MAEIVRFLIQIGVFVALPLTVVAMCIGGAFKGPYVPPGEIRQPWEV